MASWGVEKYTLCCRPSTFAWAVIVTRVEAIVYTNTIRYSKMTDRPQFLTTARCTPSTSMTPFVMFALVTLCQVRVVA